MVFKVVTVLAKTIRIRPMEGLGAIGVHATVNVRNGKLGTRFEREFILWLLVASRRTRIAIGRLRRARVVGPHFLRDRGVSAHLPWSSRDDRHFVKDLSLVVLQQNFVSHGEYSQNIFYLKARMNE